MRTMAAEIADRVQLLEDALRDVQFAPNEWQAWNEFFAWQKAEEKEIEDEAQFREQLAAKHGMTLLQLNCVLTLGIHAGGRDEQGERHGLGRTIFPNTDTFEGEMLHGARHGFGKYTWHSKAANKVDRRILKLFAEWRVYTEGQQSRGEAHEERGAFIARLSKSLGVHTERIHVLLQRGNGHPFYEGSFVNDAKHGEGVLKNDDGSLYIGQFAGDRRSGLGTMYYPNGDVYTGGWSNGAKHGEGVYEFFGKHCKYEGLWQDGVLVSGRWVLSDGTFYEGSFKDLTPVPAAAEGEDAPPPEEDAAPLTVRKTVPAGAGVFVFPHVHGLEVTGTFDDKCVWHPEVQ